MVVIFEVIYIGNLLVFGSPAKAFSVEVTLQHCLSLLSYLSETGNVVPA